MYFLQHRGTWLVSMLSTSPILQANPFDTDDLRAFNGGHWLATADMFNNGSIAALAYETLRSKTKFKVEPQKSYNCGCLTSGKTPKTKSTWK